MSVSGKGRGRGGGGGLLSVLSFSVSIRESVCDDHHENGISVVVLSLPRAGGNF